ncbi:flavin reductase family protein [Candidatus Formimonas warabiya]|uniref:Flavin reductase n=1 Tax=Formimonas warabiya TaxID=1761012 RepID=A0A3G1KXJ2_FORW1|nr:flavin reductase family protein [Candidatus Formimonas warabiya]ATW27089.1 flavin reductase [Candidatus Formimonas warabiya]
MEVDFIKGLEKALEHLPKQGAFLTVKDQDRINTMTIGWGSVGFMWQKPVFMALVRKSRYTYQLIDHADSFTVSIPYEKEMKKALTICGTISGRDRDKCKEAGISFIPSIAVGSPVIADCRQYYECKIVYKQEMNPEMLMPQIQKAMYADNDYHTLYFGEIVACYEK